MGKEKAHLVTCMHTSMFLFGPTCDLEEEAAVCGEEGSEHERFDGHELDQDVERRPGCVLERVSDGVADHSSFVGIRTFRAEHPRVLRSSSLKQITAKKWIQGNVTNLNTRNKSARKNSREGFDAEEDPDDEWGEHDKGAGRDHLLNGGISGDLDAIGIIGLSSSLHEAGNGVELPSDFLDHFQGCAADTLHGKHGTDDQPDEHFGGQNIDGGDSSSAYKCTKECEGYQGRRTNGKTLERKNSKLIAFSFDNLGSRLRTKEQALISKHKTADVKEQQENNKAAQHTFPMAAVVFPAASRASVRSRILWLIPAISAMPPALSLIGP
ncbi:hypothetical protein ACMD2_07589 [Ananas comosus]|uniref:Uncharacterized protein n=1 Tax=Ananas comosus TaxID=4615 RepID=A0A199UDK3_ANACO|nr:hypothetical protein ACMD2_07589 [Ananas comosus]